jgi:hypothetical protein
MRTIARGAALAALLMASPMARAEIKTAVVEYRQGDTALEGIVASDGCSPAERGFRQLGVP